MDDADALPGPHDAWGDAAADAALRADVRRLGTLLGESLVRQVGPELLDAVEKVRGLTRTDPAAADELLRGVDALTAIRLVRAFNAYFHLANVTEQVHRGWELRRRRAREGGWLERTAHLIGEGEVGPDELRRRPPGWRCNRCSPPIPPRPPAARCSPSCGPSPTSWTRRRPRPGWPPAMR